MSTAIISNCGLYRYVLTRKLPEMDNLKAAGIVDDRGSCLFIMLNPSTADADKDDPTIRRCKSFARATGCSDLVVANLYAFRAKKPAALRTAADPIGPENDEWLRKLSARSRDVVLAWGADTGPDPDRVRQVLEILTANKCRLLCLGTSKAGQPRHPLFIRGDQRLQEWIAP